MKEKNKKKQSDGRVLDWKILTRLAGYLRPYRWYFFLTLFLLVLSEFFVTLYPKILQLAIDGPIQSGDYGGLIRIGLFFGVVIIFSLLFQVGAAYLGAWIGETVIFELRQKLQEHGQRLSMSYFNRTPVGSLMARMTNDVDLLNELFSEMFLGLVSGLLTLIFIVGFLININFKLFLVTLVIVPPLLILTKWFKDRNRKAFQAIRGLNSEIVSFVQENVSGMRVVQLFGRQKKNQVDFEKLNSRYRDEYLKTVRAYSIYFPVMDFINILAVILVTVVGSWFYIRGQISLGALPAFMIYMGMFAEPLRRIFERYSNMQHAMAAAERVFDFFDTQEMIPLPSNPHSRAIGSPSQPGSVRFKRVNFGYQKNIPILKNIDFQVDAGDRIAIVGATGSGKTTTIGLLNRMYDVWSGEIQVNGQPIKDWPLQDLRKTISVVSQDHFLFSRTVAQNIGMEKTEISQEKIESVCRAIQIHHFISKLPKGYDTVIGQEGQGLSTGQKQLIAFARVLAFDPSIIVLDEATSNIDAESEWLVLDAMDKIMEGRTVIAIAHRLSTIQKVDRILVMHKGEIRETGSHEALVAQGGIYAKLYELQFKVNGAPA